MTPQTKFELWRERGDDPSRQIDAQWNERRHAEYWRNQTRRIDYQRRKDLFANNGVT